LLKTRLSHLENLGRNSDLSGKGHTSAIDTSIDTKITNLKTKDIGRRSFNLNNHSRAHETDQLISLVETTEHGVSLQPDQVESLKELLGREFEILSEGLQGRCSLTSNHYPRNLTLRNFCDFITLPTLVYELEYPRTEKIDWVYVAEKIAATFGIIMVMIAVSQSWIYPVVMSTVRMKEEGLSAHQRLQEFPWVLSDLLFPFMMEYLLAFYVIWECIVSTPEPIRDLLLTVIA
jgi:sterol O-acyltransferase